MRKIIVLLSLSLLIAATGVANNSFKLCDIQVEAMFSEATEVSLESFLGVNNLETMMAKTPAMPVVAASDKDPIVATLLAFFLGPFGVHRAYLGTETMTWVGYILTCGGIFGVVPFVDFVVLVIGLANDDISPYINNPRFFMWM